MMEKLDAATWRRRSLRRSWKPGLDPQRLGVEIIEGVLFEDFERALAILRRLKRPRDSIGLSASPLRL
jgi:hypothetical protein